MLATIWISLALAAVVAAIIVKLVRDKKAGKSSCGCNCSCCAMHGSCHDGDGHDHDHHDHNHHSHDHHH